MGSRRVKVARVVISATRYLEFVTETVAVCIINAVSVTIEVFVGVNTSSSVFCGIWIVVASQFICTTRNFKFVADAVTV